MQATHMKRGHKGFKATAENPRLDLETVTHGKKDILLNDYIVNISVCGMGTGTIPATKFPSDGKST